MTAKVKSLVLFCRVPDQNLTNTFTLLSRFLPYKNENINLKEYWLRAIPILCNTNVSK